MLFLNVAQKLEVIGIFHLVYAWKFICQVFLFKKLSDLLNMCESIQLQRTRIHHGETLPNWHVFIFFYLFYWGFQLDIKLILSIYNFIKHRDFLFTRRQCRLFILNLWLKFPVDITGLFNSKCNSIYIKFIVLMFLFYSIFLNPVSFPGYLTFMICNGGF